MLLKLKEGDLRELISLNAHRREPCLASQLTLSVYYRVHDYNRVPQRERNQHVLERNNIL